MIVSLYAMHRYDLIFYARLIESLKSLNFRPEYRLIVTAHVYNMPHVKTFVNCFFSNYFIAPIDIAARYGLISRIIAICKLRLWASANLVNREILISCDKSALFSRYFLKQYAFSLLIQQIEEIGVGYKLDLRSTILDYLWSTLLGAYYAKWFINSSSSGSIRALKISTTIPNTVKLYCIPDSYVPGSFCLPPLRDICRQKLVVLFGSRFLSWPYFVNTNYESRVETLTSIFTSLHCNLRCHDIVYIPHPLESGDEFALINHLFCGRISRECRFFSSEHYLYENRNIDYTYSIGSTSSWSAYNMGFSSKVFYKMLNFPGSVESAYNQIFTGLPESFFATQLDELLQPCIRNPLFDADQALRPVIQALS